MVEGGACIFISPETGQIIMIEQGRSIMRKCPYINKFGETYSLNSKRWDNFYLTEETGGKHMYEEYKKLYMNFRVGDEIMKERS
eukprot:CAMPEP_0202979488 /NCGR_PEP_ID=MMETSP1396-20130829/85615_1 /ASSEMBLY_ACC=CAM_ASM_000872 /TAXON_ID= /ORGANISM="Pseudokeronopsis sp., Strain Brazil" /LENGTH=83 /DNA_ID=CAMNT_0049718917 /DNA_START=1580 /DNA_END=1831 /DNA_ORIENTATION=-